MERAEALEGRARLAQLDRLADQIDETELLLYLCGNSDRNGLGSSENLAPDTRMALSSLDKASEVNSTP